MYCTNRGFTVYTIACSWIYKQTRMLDTRQVGTFYQKFYVIILVKYPLFTNNLVYANMLDDNVSGAHHYYNKAR